MSLVGKGQRPTTGDWRSWRVRNQRLLHLDADLAPPPSDPWREKPRPWSLLLALPFMPLLGVGTLVWGAVMFAASAGAAAGRVVWQAFPERGTTRRGLRWLWRMTRRELD